jgi:hypothetical protein
VRGTGPAGGRVENHGLITACALDLANAVAEALQPAAGLSGTEVVEKAGAFGIRHD